MFTEVKSVHFIGIGGTAMASVAGAMKDKGFVVTGSDQNVYPPMSNFLAAKQIAVMNGYSESNLDHKPDLVVVGNAISRGNPEAEVVLDRKLRFCSLPELLKEYFIRGKRSIVVTGTHGKTTTTSLLTWVFEHNGLNPSYLIGGIPNNFGQGARFTDSEWFILEGDEYDTAFFDKRSKFIHYLPEVAIINNLEFDHADIFPDLAAIETQFHHLVRTIPANGLIISNGADLNLERVLGRGCWTPLERFALASGWQAGVQDASGAFDILWQGDCQGRLKWDLLGVHNQLNALAAIAAARHGGVPPAVAIEALAQFRNVRRRMEVKGVIKGVTVYDDFAHHPTAIETTLAGLRARVNSARIIAVLEPRSNTMKQGVMKERLAASLAAADRVFCYSAGLAWDANAVLAPLGDRIVVCDDFDRLLQQIVAAARTGDHIVIMSNGGFGGIHDKLLKALA